MVRPQPRRATTGSIRRTRRSPPRYGRAENACLCSGPAPVGAGARGHNVGGWAVLVVFADSTCASQRGDRTPRHRFMPGNRNPRRWRATRYWRRRDIAALCPNRAWWTGPRWTRRRNSPAQRRGFDQLNAARGRCAHQRRRFRHGSSTLVAVEERISGPRFGPRVPRTPSLVVSCTSCPPLRSQRMKTEPRTS